MDGLQGVVTIEIFSGVTVDTPEWPIPASCAHALDPSGELKSCAHATKLQPALLRTDIAIATHGVHEFGHFVVSSALAILHYALTDRRLCHDAILPAAEISNDSIPAGGTMQSGPTQQGQQVTHTLARLSPFSSDRAHALGKATAHVRFENMRCTMYWYYIVHAIFLMPY